MVQNQIFTFLLSLAGSLDTVARVLVKVHEIARSFAACCYVAHTSGDLLVVNAVFACSAPRCGSVLGGVFTTHPNLCDVAGAWPGCWGRVLLDGYGLVFCWVVILFFSAAWRAARMYPHWGVITFVS